ncbi:MAG TPA: hypothetical protein VLD62_03475 [Acidimicrobiia bacterium]|nr:hypothetical protein [Acidimicrobiia bacterium]
MRRPRDLLGALLGGIWVFAAEAAVAAAAIAASIVAAAIILLAF